MAADDARRRGGARRCPGGCRRHPTERCRRIAEACRRRGSTPMPLPAPHELGGVPGDRAVEQLRSAVGGDAADYVHRGATSQDILDTAAMVVIAVLRHSPPGVSTTARPSLIDWPTSTLTPMIGRTLGQFALRPHSPTSPGVGAVGSVKRATRWGRWPRPYPPARRAGE